MYTVYVHEHWVWTHITDPDGNVVPGVTAIAFVSDGNVAGLITGRIEITRYKPATAQLHPALTRFELDEHGKPVTEVLRGEARLARAAYP